MVPHIAVPNSSARVSSSGGPVRRISVALCTYNGERHLEAQLDSILGQSRLPDELVACDDGSTDGSVAILDRFRERAPFQVRIERNQSNLGSTRNFERAIRLCTGDLIATCDQDDVWLPQKLALSAAKLDELPECGLVFSNAEVVDDGLRPLGHTMWEAIHFSAIDRWRVRTGRAFEVLLRQWLVTGATMMFRADLRPWVLPVPDHWIHDGWIAFIIGAMAPIALVAEPLVMYRQHAAQQIGGKRLSWRELYHKARGIGPAQHRLAFERFRSAQERLQTLAAGLTLAPGVLLRMDRKVRHQLCRLNISESRFRSQRALWALGELLRGGYARYSPSYTHFLADLLL